MSSPVQPATPAAQAFSAKDHFMAAGGASALLLLVFLPQLISGEGIFNQAIIEQYYLMGQYAFDHEIARSFYNGWFPLWNQHNALGTPLLGNMLSTVFYPLKALVYLVPGLWARELYILLRLFIAGYFSFLLARSHGLSRGASALVMAIFTLCGYFRMFVNENYLNADVLLPLLLILIDRLVAFGRRRDMAFLALLFFTILNCGHPEAAFYGLLFGGLYFLSAADWSRPSVLTGQVTRFSGAFVAGFILSLPMLLPFLEYWMRGYHFHVPGSGFFHYPINQAPALLSPWFFAQVEPGAPFFRPVEFIWRTAHGLPGYSEGAVPWLIPWAGMVPVFLFILAVSKLRSLSRQELFFAGFVIFFLGVMFGLPGFNLIGFVPLFDFSGNFKHPMPALTLALALLAGRGLEGLARGKFKTFNATVVLASLPAAILVFLPLHDPLPAGLRYLNSRTALEVAILLLLGGWLILGSRLRLNRNLLLLVGFIGVLPGVIMDGQWPRGRNPGYLEQIENSEALALLYEKPGPFRTYISQDLFPPNLNIPLGLSDIRVMDGINDRRLVRAINRINGHDRVSAGNYWYKQTGYLQPMPQRIDHSLLRLFNVKYALMAGPLPWNSFIDQVLEQAQRIAPGPGHIGKTRLPYSNATAPALFQHPPSKLSLPLDLPGSEHGSYGLKFKPGIDPKALSIQSDGVWFMTMVSTNANESLLYTRYQDPSFQPADRNVGEVRLRLSEWQDAQGEFSLDMMTLPHGSSDHDWSGWGDLRLGRWADMRARGFKALAGGDVWLYHNSKALDRAFIAADARVLDSETAVLDALTKPGFDPETTVLFSGIEQLPAVFDTSVPGEARIVEYSAQRVAVQTDLKRPGYLVLGDLYYPGWRCKVNGQEIRILRADLCLRAVAVPKGPSRVEFVYRPWSFRVSLWSATVCFIALLGIILNKRKVNNDRS